MFFRLPVLSDLLPTFACTLSMSSACCFTTFTCSLTQYQYSNNNKYKNRITKNITHRGQQQTPWTMLARFGCEDRSFTLEIPPEIEEEQELNVGETFELTSTAFDFLYNLAVNAPSWKARDEAWGSFQTDLKYIRTNTVLDDKIPNRKYVHNDQGGDITWGDLKDILSVMPDVTHPWSYAPICQVCLYACPALSAPNLCTLKRRLV